MIGTKFGNGDNINTFNVPNLKDRFLEGANGNLGTVKEAGLPNITGNSGAYLRNQKATRPTGAFYFNGSITLGTGSANVDWQKLSFDASRMPNSIYGKSNTVQPNSVCVNYIIKY